MNSYITYLTPIYEKQNFLADDAHYERTHLRVCTEMGRKITIAVNIIKTFFAILLLNKCVRGTPQKLPAEPRFTRHAFCVALDWKLSAVQMLWHHCTSLAVCGSPSVQCKLT